MGEWLSIGNWECGKGIGFRDLGRREGEGGYIVEEVNGWGDESS